MSIELNREPSPARRPLDRYRFITYKCRPWLCRGGDGWHTHHLLAIIPPFRKRNR